MTSIILLKWGGYWMSDIHILGLGEYSYHASPSLLGLNRSIFFFKMLWFQFDILFTYSKYCTYLSTKVLMSKLDISYFLWQKSCFNFIPQGYVIRIWFGIYLLNEWVVVFAHDFQPSMICKHWFLSLFFHF